MGDKMTLDELYNIWKQTVPKCEICEHGGLCGGPGYIGFGKCNLPQHSDVKYGTVYPTNCQDFMECSESKKYSIFMTIYRTHKDFYDSEYHIEQEDEEIKEKEYQRHVKEDNFNRLQKLYNRTRK